MKPVLIISVQRSGLHFLQNTLVLNYKEKEFELGMLFDGSKYPSDKENSITEVHHHKDRITSDFKRWEQNYKMFAMIRQGKDVISSLYFRFGKKYSFKDFLRKYIVNDNTKSLYAPSSVYNIVDYWAKHVESWLPEFNKGNIHFVGYEQLLYNFKNTFDGLVAFLGQAPDSYETPDLWKCPCPSKRTGYAGDWKNHFDKEDIKFFNQYAGETQAKVNTLFEQHELT